MNAYEYRHIIALEETNLVGNVYYANHVRWQGRVREMFLRDHCPELIDELEHGLSMVTVRVACDYYHELYAFDEVVIRMRAGAVTQGRITMLYDYLRQRPNGLELIAQGEQQVAFLRPAGEYMAPVPIPPALREALRPYAGPGVMEI